MGQNSIQHGIQDQPEAVSNRWADSVRLDSWKEIASYLHRDARTVRRWERERRLPIHRFPGGERSGVFAYVSELERWLRTKDDQPVALPPGTSPETVVTAADFAATGADNPPAWVPAIALDPSAPAGGNDRDSTASSFTSEVPLSGSVRRGGFMPDGVTPSDAASHDRASASPEGSASMRKSSWSGSFSFDGVRSALLPAGSSQWALYGWALVLIVAILGTSTFAFVHYRGFRPSASESNLPSLEAKELYLRGRYFWNLRTEEGLNRSVDLFTQSIVNDPHYAPAYAGLADAYLLLRQYGHMPDSEAYPRALAAARRAVALDPSCPDAHRSLAFVARFWNWDMAAAEREYLRAIEIDPKSSLSHHRYATALLSSGRIQEALAQIDIARELEPQSVSVLADRGLILGSLSPDRGVETLKQLAQSQPDFASTHVYLARLYLDRGDHGGFLAESRSAAALLHDSAKLAGLDRAQQDLKSGGPVAMLHHLASTYALLADHGEGSAYAAARLFGFAGDPSQAMRYLQLACDRRDPDLLSVESDAAFREMRSSQPYLTLRSRRDLLPDGRKQRIASMDPVAAF